MPEIATASENRVLMNTYELYSSLYEHYKDNSEELRDTMNVPIKIVKYYLDGQSEEEVPRITEDMIMQQAEFEYHIDIEDFWDSIKRFDKEHPGDWVITGEVGKWNGTYKIRNEYAQTLYGAIERCIDIRSCDLDYVVTFVAETEDTVAHFDVSVSHHDGTNSFSIYLAERTEDDDYDNDSEVKLISFKWEE